ncbi:TorF family putative porin [Pseudoxanthomonas daejeonensis]|uniref:TorF family putative porin n=1 Tax=Pseudoxanthomonas daejeonensis TaxID=266062 RepID=UPI001F543721|nr:TorF family putative porin [Pseudoxanthomonas daejeonensis]UNK57959.1 TorF family putative porin [Pseudoxanthomonas daejeonensis]
MKPSKLAVSLAAVVLSVLPFAVFAQEAEEESSPLTWSVAAVSDYVWRGVSQTDEDPTAQAGLTYSHSSGFYVGTWASGVDFGPGDPSVEVDGFIGYSIDLSPDTNFDVMINRYMYPDAGGLNFNELIGKFTFFDAYSVTMAFSDDFGGSDTNAYYVAGAGSWGLPGDFSLNAGVGYNSLADSYGEDYVDYNIGVSRSWGLFTAALGYYGTDGNGTDNFGDLADDRVVLTLSVGN